MIDKICELPEGYRPSDSEAFMNDLQREYFRRKLIAWKDDLLRGDEEVMKHLQDDTQPEADVVDQATTESGLALELRTKERAVKLMAKIDAALARIENKTYGYCAETGEPIGLKRLEARPVATLSIEAQERHERQEKLSRT